MAIPQHSGSVYKHQGKNEWKERWLCLETDGTLTWKKKDAYEVKGIAFAPDILDQIQISGWPVKKCEQNKNATPFLLRIPIEIRGSKKNKTMILKSGPDLDLWLDAFATVVGKWKLWKACKQRQAFKIGKDKSMDERSVENQLKYEEMVEFYKAAWAAFLASYKKKEVEVAEQQNGASHNTITCEDAPSVNHERNGYMAKENPPIVPSNPDPSVPPTYAAAAARSQTQTQSITVQSHHSYQVTTSATVHTQINGQKTQKKENEVYGVEDDGDEMRF